MENENKEIEQVEETEVNHTEENLKSVGQMIIGGIEMVGGIITADGITRQEGDFNIEVGSQHQETNKNLTAIDDTENVEKSEEMNPQSK